MKRYVGGVLAGIFGGMIAAIAAEIPNGGTFEPPVMGWSSWNTYRIHISDSLIRRQADAMVATGLKDAGYRYVNIDDGFFGCRDKTGRLQVHSGRFPRGLKCVADYIHSKGLRAGIYSDAGSNTCGSIWDRDPNGIGVGMYGFEAQDADLYFNEWGFDFIKIDYCGAGQQLDLDEEKRYREIRQAIDSVCDRDISVNVCRWAYPGTWVKEIGQSWRISADITPDWWSVKAIIDKNLYLSAYAAEGHYNDMDMLEIGRGLRPNEEEVHFGMGGMMSSPLLIGCDLTAIPPASLELLKNPELIALNQDALGLQARVIQHDGEGYVLAKDIEQKRGKVRAVALYNPSDTSCIFSVPLSLLELDGKTKIRDLVRRQDEGFVKESLCDTLPARSVRILRLKAQRRLDPVRYEAEWAWMPLFSDLKKRSRGVCYKPYAKASGGMVIANLGGEDENYAEWNDIHVRREGNYRICIAYVPTRGNEREIPDRILELDVNGEKLRIEELETAPAAGICTVARTIRLKAGYNRIRMGSSRTWTPDIDCFTLEYLN